MTEATKKKDRTKPFLKGSPTDENTVRNAFRFFGILIMTAFISFIVCSMTSFKSVILRVGINLVIEALILFIFFNKGADLGTDGVARGEILYQHEQKGQDISAGERKIPFHPFKGAVIGLLGTLIPLILALILALTAQRQMTGPGVLPSWMDTYLRRSEIGDALAGYSQSATLTVTDIVRIVIRIAVMPFITMAGSENRDLLLAIERLSPILVLLPAASYAAGTLTGPSQRKKVHEEIARNNRKRASREKREQKKRRNGIPKSPEQLN